MYDTIYESQPYGFAVLVITDFYRNFQNTPICYLSLKSYNFFGAEVTNLELSTIN